MKKIKLLAVFFLLSIGITYAQHLKKDGTPDRRYKENRNYSPSSKNTTTTSPTSNPTESNTDINSSEQNITKNNTSSTYVQCSGTTKKGGKM